MVKKKIIGLIGGIGSGKSLVASEFARQGAYLINGDALGHEALRQPDIKAQVIARWGQGIQKEDGEIDRRKVAGIVFADLNELRALEALVFPWIKRRIGEEIARAQADPHVPFILLDAAVMLEAGWDGPCDHLVFVDTPAEVRFERLARQRGWKMEEVIARESAQMPLGEKRNRADAMVQNSGPPEQVAPQVATLLTRWGLGKDPGSARITKPLP